MAEEKPVEAAPKSSGMLGTLIAVIVAIVVAVAGGLAVYLFVLAPRFQSEPTETVEPAPPDVIPPEAVAYDFKEAQAAARAETADSPASVLIYSVSMICSNEETKKLIEKNSQWFIAMLAEKHSGKTKAELNDPATKKSITREALEEGNSLLRRLQPKPDQKNRIIQVLHLKYSVFDL